MAPISKKQKVPSLTSTVHGLAPQPTIVPKKVVSKQKKTTIGSAPKQCMSTPTPLPLFMPCVPPIPSIDWESVQVPATASSPSSPVTPAGSSRQSSLGLSPNLRCRGSSSPVTVSPEAVSSKVVNTRGRCTSSTTQFDIAFRRNGRKHPLVWDPQLRCGSRSDDLKSSRVVFEIGYFVRTYVPILKESFNDLPPEDQQIVFDHLSVLYDFDQHHAELRKWIIFNARRRYNDWRSVCRKAWLAGGTTNPPEQIGNRLSMWRELCASFGTEDQVAKSTAMINARKELKVFHTSGSRTFLHHANAHRASGSVAPHIEAYIGSYKNTKKNPHPQAKVDELNALKAKVDELKALKAQSDECGSSTQTVPSCISFATEVKILESVIGVKDGTVIRGIGSMPMREPRAKHKSAANLKDKAPSPDFMQKFNKMEKQIELLMEMMKSIHASKLGPVAEEKNEQVTEVEEEEEEEDGQEEDEQDAEGEDDESEDEAAGNEDDEAARNENDEEEEEADDDDQE